MTNHILRLSFFAILVVLAGLLVYLSMLSNPALVFVSVPAAILAVAVSTNKFHTIMGTEFSPEALRTALREHMPTDPLLPVSRRAGVVGAGQERKKPA